MDSDVIPITGDFQVYMFNPCTDIICDDKKTGAVLLVSNHFYIKVLILKEYCLRCVIKQERAIKLMAV